MSGHWVQDTTLCLVVTSPVATQTFLSFDDLDSFEKADQLFSGMFLNWGFLFFFFSSTFSGVICNREEEHRVKYPSHQITSRTHNRLCCWVSPLQKPSFLSPFTYCAFWRKITRYSPSAPWSGELFSSHRWNSCTNYLEFFSMGDESVLPPIYILQTYQPQRYLSPVPLPCPTFQMLLVLPLLVPCRSTGPGQAPVG